MGSGNGTTHNNVTHLCIVRHGESAWNVEKRVQGQLDPDLTELGLRQAQAVAQRLGEEAWDALYSSDLTRTRKTAQAIAARIGLEIRLRVDLRERCQGCLEGLLSEEARIRYPDWNAPELGRESKEALRERAKKAFAEIIAAHPGQRIVVVSHGGLIRQFMEHLHSLGVGSGGVNMDNTSITRVEWDGNYRLLCVNDTAHLSVQGDLCLVSGGQEEKER